MIKENETFSSGEQSIKKFTKDDIIKAIKNELLESYGSLSANDGLPYIVLGVVNTAFKRLESDEKKG